MFFRYCRTRHFRHNIPIGASKCCPWDNKQCNNSNADRNNQLPFLVNSYLYYYIYNLVLFLSVRLLKILNC